MIKHPKEFHVKVPDALGDTVISTAVMHALGKAYFPDTKLIVHAKNSSLLESCRDIDELHPLSEFPHPRDKYISLDGYLDQMPHTTPPYPHISRCMINEAETELRKQDHDVRLVRSYKPGIILADEELYKSMDEMRELKEKYGKKILWISTKTSSPNKDWPQEYWNEVIDAAGKDFTFLELLASEQAPINEKVVEGRYGLRETLATIAASDVGITPDTFTLHAAGALLIHLPPASVITILGSSRPSVVSYPGFTDLFVKSEKTERCQPCGNHGYFSGGKVRELEHQLGIPFHKCSRCTFTEGSEDEYACMKQVTPGMVIDKLLELE